MTRDERLRRLTARWRQRRDDGRLLREAARAPRQPADPDRLDRARRLFPYREMTPAAYVATHGSAMGGYTYDDYAYPDPALQDWLDEVGRLLRDGPMATSS
jgi:hypothetical protein